MTGYRFAFTPEQRGDYVFVLKAPPIFLEEEAEFVQDVVKVIYHVQAQKGWDAPVGAAGLQWTPLTRPYGLEPGMFFQAQTTPWALAEVERYNTMPPKTLPPDEHITRGAHHGARRRHLHPDRFGLVGPHSHGERTNATKARRQGCSPAAALDVVGVRGRETGTLTLMTSFSPLLAVHISDGVLTMPWIAGGFALAALLVFWSSRHIRDEEIPRIALLTAAFFVASLLHVRAGPTSVHLLLNGLVGVVLGRRAVLAIVVGLFLQVALINHGGFLTLGVNTGIALALPASWPVFCSIASIGRHGSTGTVCGPS